MCAYLKSRSNRTFVKDSTSNGYDLLLEQLDENHVVADEKYIRLRYTLVNFLERLISSNHNVDRQLLADKALESLSRKLEGGFVIEESIIAISKTIAKGLWLNYYRDHIKDKKFIDYDDYYHGETYRIESEEAVEITCMRSCLSEVCKDDEERKAIIDYFDQRNEKLKEQRKLIAERFQITMNTLAARVMRLREKLNKCKDECLKKHATVS